MYLFHFILSSVFLTHTRTIKTKQNKTNQHFKTSICRSEKSVQPHSSLSITSVQTILQIHASFFIFFDFIVLDWIEFKFNSYDHKTTTTTHNTKREKRRQKHKQQPCLGMELLGFYLRLATNGREGHHWPHHTVLDFYTVEEEIQQLGLLALLCSHQQSASTTIPSTRMLGVKFQMTCHNVVLSWVLNNLR